MSRAPQSGTSRRGPRCSAAGLRRSRSSSASRVPCRVRDRPASPCGVPRGERCAGGGRSIRPATSDGLTDQPPVGGGRAEDRGLLAETNRRRSGGRGMRSPSWPDSTAGAPSGSTQPIARGLEIRLQADRGEAAEEPVLTRADAFALAADAEDRVAGGEVGATSGHPRVGGAQGQLLRHEGPGAHRVPRGPRAEIVPGLEVLGDLVGPGQAGDPGSRGDRNQRGRPRGVLERERERGGRRPAATGHVADALREPVSESSPIAVAGSSRLRPVRCRR